MPKDFGSLRGFIREARSKLGPIAAKSDERSGITTQNKAKRTNQIDFGFLLCKQGVAGSIPATSTKSLPFADRAGFNAPAKILNSELRVMAVVTTMSPS